MAGTSRGDMFLITVSPEQAPDRPTYVEIDFVSRCPGRYRWHRLQSSRTVTETLNRLAGENGVGRVDMVENRFVGMKSAACMRPRRDRAGTLRIGLSNPSPWTARSCTSATSQPAPMRSSSSTTVFGSPQSVLCCKPPLMRRSAMSRGLSGSNSTRELSRGGPQIGARSLYRNDCVTFEVDQVYNQHDAEGFIRLNGLRLKIRSARSSAATFKKHGLRRAPLRAKVPACTRRPSVCQ